MAETELPASYAQEQVWFIDNFHDGFPAHNLPHLLWLRGPLDVTALTRALDTVIARHEALRTRLVAGPGGRPVQVIDPPSPAGLELTNAAGSDEDAVRELAVAEALRPFQLAADRPLRARLFRLGPDEHLLTIVAHRAAVDDYSLRIVLAELPELYAAEAGAST